MRISDWSSDVCSSDLAETKAAENRLHYAEGEAARQKELLAEGISSQAQYDQAVLAVQTAKQSIQTARQQSESVRATRSEEHTSELQSLMRISYAVFCLKKKTL